MNKYLLAMLLLLIFISIAYAEESWDTLTFATYYPAPYGVYNQVQAYKMALGDTNNDNALTEGDQPPANGQLYVARSVIYEPQDDLDAIKGLPSPKEGELVYNQSEYKFYYNNTGNNNGWVALGGGSVASGVTMISAEGSSCTHPNACKYCYDLSAPAAVAMNGDTTTTYTDWRLPSIEEATIFEGTITSGNYIWTSSIFPSTTYERLTVNLSNGDWTILVPTGGAYVRCVR